MTGNTKMMLSAVHVRYDKREAERWHTFAEDGYTLVRMIRRITHTPNTRGLVSRFVTPAMTARTKRVVMRICARRKWTLEIHEISLALVNGTEKVPCVRIVIRA